VDTNFFIGTTNTKRRAGDGKEYNNDKVFYQNNDGGRTLDKLNFSLSDGEKFGVNLGWSMEGAVDNAGGVWGNNTFTANGWINFLDKKLKTTAGTDGLDFDIYPIDGLAALIGLDFPEGDLRGKGWTPTQFFFETNYTIKYAMPNLVSLELTLDLDSTADGLKYLDDDWIDDLSPLFLRKLNSITTIVDYAPEFNENGSFIGYVPIYGSVNPFSNVGTETWFYAGVNLTMIPDLTAGVDVTLWSLGSKAGKLSATPDKVTENGDTYYNPKGLGATKIHANLGYKIMGGQLSFGIQPVFVLFAADKEDYADIGGTLAPKEAKAHRDAQHQPILDLPINVGYNLNDTMSVGLDFGLRFKFDWLTKITVKPSLSWQVVPNAKIAFSFELANTNYANTYRQDGKATDALLETTTKVAFGFTF
jgi:hypothetical protein